MYRPMNIRYSESSRRLNRMTLDELKQLSETDIEKTDYSNLVNIENIGIDFSVPVVKR